MNAPRGPGDAELVARVLEADREAFALVYDRYGPRLYDFAYSMLRHREDAADAVADSFVRFAEKLPQLRDPERLRPWLYAIVRSECLRRLRARKRISYGDDEQLVAVADDAITPEQAAEQAALRTLVWDAAAGLADRDRALLDLHLRQGLEGAELGEAMGVSAGSAYVMLNRLRAQVDRSLGALLVARLGRDDCDELRALLRSWDGTYSPLIRKRVARHVEGCEICGERRTRILSPWALLAGVPLFAAPVGLRDRVLRDTRLVAASGPPTATSRWSTRGKAVAGAAAFVVAASLTTIVVWPDSDPSGTAVPQVTVTSEAPGQLTETPQAPTPTLQTPTSPAPGTPSPRVSSAAPSPTSHTPSVAPGTVALSTRSVDLGRTRSTSTVTLHNPGGSAVAFRVTPDRPWLSAFNARSLASGVAGELAPGATRRITIRADRATVPEGPSRGRLQVTWRGGSARVVVSLEDQNDPVVGAPRADADPSCKQPAVAVSASVSDQSALTSVQLLWSGSEGDGSAAMSGAGDVWTAEMGPFRLGGTVTFRVVATDRFGNRTTGPSSTVEATPCPG